MKILVTGGAGFIGSAVVRHTLNETDHSVVNLDSLTYAGNPETLVGVDKDCVQDVKQVVTKLKANGIQ